MSKKLKQLDLEEVIANTTYEELAAKIYSGKATKKEEMLFSDWSEWYHSF